MLNAATVIDEREQAARPSARNQQAVPPCLDTTSSPRLLTGTGVGCSPVRSLNWVALQRLPGQELVLLTVPADHSPAP